LVLLYQICGGQFKYSGHCCNFARDNAIMHKKVPLLPEECDVIVMQRKGVDPATNEDKWLEYLELNHPTFQSRVVTVDWAKLDRLPENASVRDQLRTVESQEMPETGPDEGPPEGGENPQEQDPLFTRGFVPNVTAAQTEIEQLHAAAFHNDTPVVLTMPAVHGTPINEHSGHSIAINAFPSLFPAGAADFAATREIPVTMTEWAAHLMRFKDGRFARHPRFRYWALNTVMRHEAKKASRWF
ncbi:hypothetical protein B0H17DRAFT_878604, partial [Mycena rosella]